MAFGIEPADNVQIVPSDEQKERDAKAKEAEAAKAQSGKFVQYLGPQGLTSAVSRPSGHSGGPGGAYEARITASQWQVESIAADTDHHWHAGNNWRIPIGQFSKTQLDHLLTAGKDAKVVRFAVVDGKGNRVSR